MVLAGVLVWVGVGVWVMVGVSVLVGVGVIVRVDVGVGDASGPQPSRISSVNTEVIKKMAFFAGCVDIIAFRVRCF